MRCCYTCGTPEHLRAAAELPSNAAAWNRAIAQLEEAVDAHCLGNAGGQTSEVVRLATAAVEAWRALVEEK